MVTVNTPELHELDGYSWKILSDQGAVNYVFYPSSARLIIEICRIIEEEPITLDSLCIEASKGEGIKFDLSKIESISIPKGYYNHLMNPMDT